MTEGVARPRSITDFSAINPLPSTRVGAKYDLDAEPVLEEKEDALPL